MTLKHPIEIAREKIQSDVADYLARGGKIREFGNVSVLDQKINHINCCVNITPRQKKQRIKALRAEHGGDL